MSRGNGESGCSGDKAGVAWDICCADTLEVGLGFTDLLAGRTVGGETGIYVGSEVGGWAEASSVSVGRAPLSEEPGV